MAKRRKRRNARNATVNVHEAKTHLSRLLERIERGDDVIIARAGRPVARLVPYAPPVSRRVLGQAAGTITVTADFDELPDDLARAFDEGPVFPAK
jgi:prevent-host-death family protein